MTDTFLSHLFSRFTMGRVQNKSKQKKLAKKNV